MASQSPGCEKKLSHPNILVLSVGIGKLIPALPSNTRPAPMFNISEPQFPHSKMAVQPLAHDRASTRINTPTTLLPPPDPWSNV